MRSAALAALLLAAPVHAEWVAQPDACYVPDAAHEHVTYDLVPHLGRYTPIRLEASGVPADAVFVELVGELAVEREGEGSCSVWVGVAGAEAAPDERPFVSVHGNEWQKSQSWVLRVVPQDSTVTLRLMKSQNNPTMRCGFLPG